MPPKAKKETGQKVIEKGMEKGEEGVIEKKSKSDPKVMNEYFRLQIQFFLSHGPRIFLLMQIGAFYEIYGKRLSGIVGEKEEYNPESLMAEFLELTDYKKMEKGQLLDGKEVVGAGFRDYQLDELLGMLVIQSGYTVVVFSQKSTKKDGVQERELTGIYSPGTYVSGIEEEMGMGLGGKMIGKTTNHIMCIWTAIRSKKNGKRVVGLEHQLIVGVSVMNIFSGQSFILEYEKKIELCWTGGAIEYIYHPSLFDELERYVYTYQPNETLVIGSKESVEAVLDYTGLRNGCPMNHVFIEPEVDNMEKGSDVIGKSESVTKEEKLMRCKKQKYIQAMLGSVFGEKSVSQCTEWDEYPIATRSFCFLMDFVRDHRPELVRKLSIPIFHNTTDRVILANHTLQQLNILEVEDAKGLLEIGGGSRGNLKSVAGFLNRALTPMGKRRIQECLVSPTFSETKLEKEYSMIETLLERDGVIGVIDIIRENMRGIQDLERIRIQLSLGNLCPGLLYKLYLSLEKIISIETHLIEKMPKVWLEGVIDSFSGGERTEGIGGNGKKLLNYLRFSSLEIEACKGINSMNFNGNEPVIIYTEEIEEMTREILEIQELFTTLMEKCNEFLGQEWVHLKKTEKGQWSLELTKIRGRQFQGKMDEISVSGGVGMEWIHGLRIAKQGNSESMVCVTNDKLVKACSDRMNILEKRNAYVVKLYQEFLVKFYEEWSESLIYYGKYAGVIDMLQCKAYLAREYHYCRPRLFGLESGRVEEEKRSANSSLSSIMDSENEMEEYSENGMEKRGMIQAQGLRHILIEHLQQREIYVANDVCLGEDTNGRGWLVYGTNAVGKTSFIRAVGIAIIMAQAGFYVPCSSFLFRPYRSIYTRILGNDNLFKGMSSFDVEMSELRVILREADSRSLILGDELCSGTEMESALSIFVASLEHLVSVNSSFLFATHFHEIVYYSEIEKMIKEGGISLKHLTVHYDAESGKLVYDRRLKEGPGNARYGLEVCKSLYLPVAFIDRAYEIRKKYAGYVGGRRMVCIDGEEGSVGGGGGEDGSIGGNSMIRLDDSPSVYNSQKMRGVCEKCRRELGEEVHHKVPQKKANGRGLILGQNGEVFHKNHKANLMTLCHNCHLQEHYMDSSS